MGALVITHYQRILHYIKPARDHVLVDGRIVRTGGPELAHELERDGYAPYGMDEEAVPVATTELTREEAQATAIGEYKFGFHDDMVPVFKDPERA